MKKDELKKVYKYDEEKKCFIVEISLDYYLEMFNDWDAAPLKRKDLEPELVEYLENVAEDIPLHQNISIVFMMPKSVENTQTESVSRQVFINYYGYLIHLNQRQIRRNWKRSFGYLTTGIIFLIAATLLPTGTTLPLEVLSQGMYIGGWVFAWEAISAAVFQMSELRAKNKRYLRYQRAQIDYVYRPQNPSES
ncbi:MAG: hypothetical protein PHP32_02360 [Candidatus Izemoplasmatales bacterium]|jgi:hypothetical protein|nr:hypothetical protein [Candidatus Izemoplasmatales bacterium]